MKKHFKFFALAFSMLTMVAMLGSCSSCKEEEKTSETEKTAQLLAPEISVNDNGIFWTEVVSAEGYKTKLNNGEWQTWATDDRMYQFPEIVGEYTFSVVATSTENVESEAATIVFEVNQAEASVSQTDNVLTFIGDNIYYSVNGGETAKVPDNKMLDFSEVAVGTALEITYYTQGGYWAENENVYYVDSEKKTVDLTVSATLSAPILRVNESGTGLTWEAVANGAEYEITVDGTATTLSANDGKEVMFPKSVGPHTITVKALENGVYKSSVASMYKMTVQAPIVPQVTYDSNSQKIVWDEKYESLMLRATSGSFTKINASEIVYTEGLTLKLGENYDETNKTLYLESKALSFATRQAPQITFTKSGNISWNPDDEGTACSYYYSLTANAAQDDFAVLQTNKLDASVYEAGEYVLKIYGSTYLEENDETATLHLPSETANIVFSVLPAPALTYTTGTLCWVADERATKYEVMIEGGEWDEATLNATYEASEFATYYVRAIGNETVGEYAITSQATSIFFDPTLNETDGTVDIANFNDEKYLQNVGTSREGNTTSGGITSILKTSEDATEQAILAGANGGVLKLTASNAAPKNENTWGNFDGISFDFFKSIDGAKGGKILVRLYMTSNPNRAFKGEDDDVTDKIGGWEAYETDEKDANGYKVYEKLPADLEGYITYELHRSSGASANFWKKRIATDQWVEILVEVPADWTESDITGLSLNFHNNGQEGDVIYIDEVRWIEPETNATTIEFNTNEALAKTFSYAFTAKNGVELVKDTVGNAEKTVLKASGVWKSDALKVDYADLKLPKGTQITLTLKAVIEKGTQKDTSGGIYINGKTDWRVNFSTAGAWNTVSFTLSADTILSSIYIWQYDADNPYHIYVESIVIESGVSLDTKSVNFTNPASADYNRKAFSYSGNMSATLESDATYGTVLKQSGMWALNQDKTQRGLIVSFADLEITTDATITIVVKLEGTGHDWLAVGINGTENTAGYNSPNGEWTTVTIDVTAGTVLSSLYLNSTTSAHSFNLYVASIVIS
jgi:uncharacterized protein YpmB